MRFSTSTAALLTATAATAAAKCYKHGDKGNQLTASDSVPQVCTSFIGNIYPGASRTACVSKESDNSYYYLEITSSGKKMQYLTQANCEKRLRDEINGCDRGGETNYDWWFAR
jgi:hypothetical protein